MHMVEGIEKLNIYDFLDYIKPLETLMRKNLLHKLHTSTDLNLDGRFVCVEDGSWKLKVVIREDIKTR